MNVVDLVLHFVIQIQIRLSYALDSTDTCVDGFCSLQPHLIMLKIIVVFRIHVLAHVFCSNVA